MLTRSRNFRRRADTVSDLILVALAVALSFGFVAQFWEQRPAAQVEAGFAAKPAPQPTPGHAS